MINPFKRVSPTILYQRPEVALDEAQKLATISTQTSIRSNKVTGDNTINSITNSNFLKEIREKTLMEPDSPRTKNLRNTNIKVINETSGQINNRFKQYRAGLGMASKDLSGNKLDLQEQLKAATASQDADAIATYRKTLGKNQGQMTKLGVQHALSYGQEAAAQTWRLLKWTQEGPMRDRVVKTAAVGGTLGAANVGGRALTGGGVTYNNDGERDIAGIPFL